MSSISKEEVIVWQCPVCEKTYKARGLNRFMLKRNKHIRKHSCDKEDLRSVRRTKEYVCTKCGRVFESYVKRKHCSKCINSMFCTLRKRINERKVLRNVVVTLRDNSYTRKEISELTGLTKHTVSNLIIEWGEEG